MTVVPSFLDLSSFQKKTTYAQTPTLTTRTQTDIEKTNQEARRVQLVVVLFEPLDLSFQYLFEPESLKLGFGRKLFFFISCNKIFFFFLCLFWVVFRSFENIFGKIIMENFQNSWNFWCRLMVFVFCWRFFDNLKTQVILSTLLC